ncbi:MAG: zinc ABC transporter substrate-binding protein [Saprospiraceae bacterium]
MKKLIICIGLLFFALQAQTQKPFKVVATASMIADMAENISGGLVDVETIVPIGGDPHIYEPTPSDAALVASADLILMNGLTFEGWLKELIENSGTSAKSILVTEGIAPIQSTQYENASDPHAWMAANNGIVYIDNITKALMELDPENAKSYEFNFKMYKQQLTDMDIYIQKEISKIPEERRVLITSHDAFQYFGRRYGVRLESVLGTSTDADVQTSDIIRLNKVIKESGVPAVFIESTINPKLLNQIAKDNNVKIGGKLFSDSIGDKDSEAPTYLDMLKHNTDAIVAALTGNKDESSLEENLASDESKDWLIWLSIGILFIGAFFWVLKNVKV